MQTLNQQVWGGPEVQDFKRAPRCLDHTAGGGRKLRPLHLRAPVQAAGFQAGLTDHRLPTSSIRFPKANSLSASQASTAYSDLHAHTKIHKLGDFSLALDFSFNQKCPRYVSAHIAVHALTHCWRMPAPGPHPGNSGILIQLAWFFHFVLFCLGGGLFLFLACSLGIFWCALSFGTTCCWLKSSNFFCLTTDRSTSCSLWASVFLHTQERRVHSSSPTRAMPAPESKSVCWGVWWGNRSESC